MSILEVLACCFIILGCLVSQYWSRFYVYKQVFKKMGISPVGLLDIRLISSWFIFWILIACSFSIPVLTSHSGRADLVDAGYMILTVLLIFLFFSLIMLIPYNLYKKHELPMYKGVLLELLLFALAYGIYLPWLMLGFLTTMLF